MIWLIEIVLSLNEAILLSIKNITCNKCRIKNIYNPQPPTTKKKKKKKNWSAPKLQYSP